MKNLFIVISILVSFNFLANENHFRYNKDFNEPTLKCYYDLNNKTYIVKHSKLYTFYINGKEEFSFLKKSSFLEIEGKKYYLGNKKKTVMDFAEYYSICF